MTNRLRVNPGGSPYLTEKGMAETDKTIMTDAEKISGPEKESAFIKCEGCGGNMIFDPETQCLKCEHCGKIVDFGKSAAVEELSIEDAFKKSEKWNDEVSVYRCSNCGAVFNIRADEVSAICPYCSTTHIVKSEDLAGVKPNALYPFTFTAQKAAEFARKWAKKRIFAPRAFKKTLEERNLRGLYLPSFTFDSNTSSYYEGRLGQRKTRTVRTSDGKTRTETYIEWHYVKGTFNKFFDDVLISSGITSQKEIDSIMPFRTDTVRVYEKEFLSGFAAGHYVRDVGQCWDDAKKVMDKTIRQDILRSYGYDVIDYLNVSTKHADVTYKYVMLPVYRLNYRFKKKDYSITVNGNTGRITGKTPISPLRVSIAVVLGLAIVCGLLYVMVKNGACSSEDVYFEFGDNAAYETVNTSVGSSFDSRLTESDGLDGFGSYCGEYRFMLGGKTLEL